MAVAVPVSRVEAYTESVTKYKSVPSGVTLTLTDDEAQALAVILGNIGGDPDETGRGPISKIADALYTAKYSSMGSKYYGLTKGSIYFNETKVTNW